MATNKLKKFITVSLLACTAGILAACDEVEASLKKADYNEKILDVGAEIPNNTLGTIYDALVNAGDSNSKIILDQILLNISKGTFGEFYGENGLKAVVADYKDGNTAKIDAFIAAHKVYAYDADKDYATEDEAVKAEIARAKVVDTYQQMLESVQESFYSYTVTSSYQTRSTFVEKKFYMNQIKSLYNIGTIDEKETPVNGAHTYKDVDKYFSANWIDVYQDYIQRSLLDGYYSKLLVSQYLYDNNYATLGRSYARDVQFVTIGTSTEYPDASQKLVNAYAHDILEERKVDPEMPAADLEMMKDLSFLADLSKGTVDLEGFQDQDKAATLVAAVYKDASFTKFTAEEIGTDAALLGSNIYKETTYGGYVTDYLKITGDRFTTNTTVEADFTGSGAHSKETGMRMKQASLLAQDKTTEGWFTSSGLTSLPSSMKSRLFRISVANQIDNNESGTYLEAVGGSHYLIPESVDKTGNTPSYVMFDSSSSNYYIVRVDEAVKSTKLSGSTGSYDYDENHENDKTYRSRVAKKVAMLLSETDSYIDSSNEFYVKKAALSFHDDKVYHYFQETFPDLFD